MKKIKNLLFIIAIMFIGIISVKAERVTDFSKLGYEIVGINETSHAHPYLKIKGLDEYLGDIDDEDDDYDYLVYVSNNSNLPTDVTHENYFKEEYNMDLLSFFLGENGWDITDYYVIRGDLYFTIYEIKFSDYSIAPVTEPMKIERLSRLPLEKRTEGVFAFDGTVISNNEPAVMDQNVNYKIGKINSDKLLRDLKNNKASAIEELFQYAKNDVNGVNGVTTDGVNDKQINNPNLIDGEYYYVYLSYDTENGKYIDLEDVWVTQASVHSDGKWFLFSRYDSSFSWDLDESISNVWVNFVESLKKNELLENVSIEYDDVSMTMSSDGISVVYYYSNGIVSYKDRENITDKEKIGVNLYQSFVLQEFFKKFGYDKEKVYDYLLAGNKLTIDNDGFEYVRKTFSYKDEVSEINGDYFSELKFDLINGLKNYKNNGTVENNPYVDQKIPESEAPKTGVALGISIVLSLITLGGTSYYLYNKTTRKNKMCRL